MGKRNTDPRKIVLRLLAVRPRSVEELRVRLRSRGVPTLEIEAMLRECIDRGMLNDAQMARAVVESVLARKPVGRAWLAAKLRQYRLPPDLAARTLAELVPRERERALARQAAEAKRALLRRRVLRKVADEPAAIHRFLAARGFSSAVIADVLDERGGAGVC